MIGAKRRQREAANGDHGAERHDDGTHPQTFGEQSVDAADTGAGANRRSRSRSPVPLARMAGTPSCSTGDSSRTTPPQPSRYSRDRTTSKPTPGSTTRPGRAAALGSSTRARGGQGSSQARRSRARQRRDPEP
jgi:hypothetical protein